MPAVRFRLDHPTEKKAASVLVQLYISNQIKPEMATGEKILQGKWDSAKQRVKPTFTGHIEINKHLQNIQDDLLQLWRDNKEADKAEIRAKMAKIIKGSALTTPSEKKTLFEALNRYIEDYRGSKAVKSVRLYETLRRRLIEFNALHPIDIDTLDFNFYDRFKQFLYHLPNRNYNGYSLHLKDGLYTVENNTDGLPVGIFDDKVYKYFINLKTFLLWAEKRDYKPHQSFKTWEIIRRKYEPISLTMAELEKLEQIDLPKHLSIARDYLVIECRTGQRISDIKRFNIKDLNDFKWTHAPKKGNRISNKKVTIHFKGYCAPAYWILQKYDFKMPELSEQKINKHIKEACRLAGIDKEIYIERWAGSKKIRVEGKKYEFISSHTGRKSFITIALQFMPPKMVKDLAGINSWDTLKHYEGDAETENIERYLTEMQDQILMRKAQ
jgi:integrase